MLRIGTESIQILDSKIPTPKFESTELKTEMQVNRSLPYGSSHTTPSALKLLAILVAVVMTTLAGCHHLGQIGCGCGFGSALFGHQCNSQGQVASPPVKKFSSFVSHKFKQQPPRRVALIPTRLGVGRYDASTKFIESLAAEIRLSGVFEVVKPEQVQCRATVDEILTGRFDEREIAEIARRYHCDAIMLVRLNEFQGHWPLKASITAAMVDANESIVTFSVDGNWDTSDPQIHQGYRSFVCSKTRDVPEEACLIHMQSPANLFAYAARQITNVMKAK